MLSDAFAFEFGSSIGSKDKDATIESFQKALIDTAQSRNARAESERSEIRATLTGSAVEQSPAPSVPNQTPSAPSTTGPEHETTVRITGRDFVAELVRLSA
jgi:hypothetical protein